MTTPDNASNSDASNGDNYSDNFSAPWSEGNRHEAGANEGFGQAAPQQQVPQSQQASPWQTQPAAQAGPSQPWQKPQQPQPQQQGQAWQPAQSQPVQVGRGGSEPQREGFFKALFDMRFTTFITVHFASMIYTVCVLIGVACWCGGFLLALVLGAAGMGDGVFTIVLALLGHLIFGTAFFFIYVIQIRLVLEFFVSNVRSVQYTKAIAERRAL